MTTRKSRAPIGVYTIGDPRTGDVYYVGITSSSLAKRLREHRSIGSLVLQAWLKELQIAGVEPAMARIEVHNDEDSALLSESEHVRRLRKLGHPILNTRGEMASLGRLTRVSRKGVQLATWVTDRTARELVDLAKFWNVSKKDALSKAVASTWRSVQKKKKRTKKSD